MQRLRAIEVKLEEAYVFAMLSAECSFLCDSQKIIDRWAFMGTMPFKALLLVYYAKHVYL